MGRPSMNLRGLSEKRMVSVVLPGVVALALVGCPGAKQSQKTLESSQLQDVAPHYIHPDSLGSVIPLRTRRFIQESNLARAVLVDGHRLQGAEESKADIWLETNPYKSRGPSRSISQSQLDTLRSLILDVRSYQIGDRMCIFKPTVVYSLLSRRDSVRIVICHTCDQVAVVGGGAGSSARVGEIDPVGLKLVQLTHEVFPEDSFVVSRMDEHLRRHASRRVSQ